MDVSLAGVAPGADVPTGYKRTEAGVIPDDWDVVRIGDVADIKNGATPSTGIAANWNGSIPWCTPTDVTNTPGKYLTGTARSITRQGLGSCGASLLPAGTLLLCSRATIGEIKIASAPVSTNQGFKSLVCTDRVHSEFLYHLTLTFKPRLIRQAIGSTFLEVGKRALASMQVQVPPLREQCAIAEALSDMDGLIESLEGLVAKKRAVKTAAMQQFLSGRTRLPGFSGEWETKCVGDVASVRDEKVLPSCVEASTLCVELDHIGQDSGRLTVHSTAESSTSSKYCFIAGDVLFGRLRPYLRKFWYADRSGICTTEIWPLVVDPKQMNGGFLYLMVQTERFMEAASISYGTHMPRADWEVVRNLEISLPSLGEQGSIVAVFADIDAEIVALEHRLAKVRALKQGTMQQLLTGRIRLPTADAPARDQVESVEEEPVGAAPMEGGVT